MEHSQLEAIPNSDASSPMDLIEEAAAQLARLGYENKSLLEFQTFFAQWKDPLDPSRIRTDALERFNEGPTLRNVVENNREDLVTMLISLEFEISESVMSMTLHQAREGRRMNILNSFLDCGWDIDRPVNAYCPPAISLLLDHVDLVEHCLARGASPNASSPSGHTVMQRAVGYAPLEVTKLLVRHGAMIKGTNLLAHAACAYVQAKTASENQLRQTEDRWETINYLLEQGASVDAHYSETINPNMQTGDGVFYGTMTALHFAIVGDKKDLLQLLLEKGASVDLRGWSSWKTEGRQVNSIELARICGVEDIAVAVEDWKSRNEPILDRNRGD